MSKPMDKRLTKERGIGVVEVIVALGLIATAFAGVSAVMQFSIRTQRTLAMRQTADLLANEGLEVVRFERDSSLVTLWSRPVDTNLYPDFSGMVASLTETDPGPVNGIYTRTIVLSRVYRDAMGDIATMGTEDTNARLATITVAWTDPFNSAQAVTREAYIMRLSQ